MEQMWSQKTAFSHMKTPVLDLGFRLSTIHNYIPRLDWEYRREAWSSDRLRLCQKISEIFVDFKSNIGLLSVSIVCKITTTQIRLTCANVDF